MDGCGCVALGRGIHRWSCQSGTMQTSRAMMLSGLVILVVLGVGVKVSELEMELGRLVEWYQQNDTVTGAASHSGSGVGDGSADAALSSGQGVVLESSGVGETLPPSGLRGGSSDSGSESQQGETDEDSFTRVEGSESGQRADPPEGVSSGDRGDSSGSDEDASTDEGDGDGSTSSSDGGDEASGSGTEAAEPEAAEACFPSFERSPLVPTSGIDGISFQQLRYILTGRCPPPMSDRAQKALADFAARQAAMLEGTVKMKAIMWECTPKQHVCGGHADRLKVRDAASCSGNSVPLPHAMGPHTWQWLLLAGHAVLFLGRVYEQARIFHQVHAPGAAS